MTNNDVKMDFKLLFESLIHQNYKYAFKDGDLRSIQQPKEPTVYVSFDFVKKKPNKNCDLVATYTFSFVFTRTFKDLNLKQGLCWWLEENGLKQAETDEQLLSLIIQRMTTGSFQCGCDARAYEFVESDFMVGNDATAQAVGGQNLIGFYWAKATVTLSTIEYQNPNIQNYFNIV